TAPAPAAFGPDPRGAGGRHGRTGRKRVGVRAGECVGRCHHHRNSAGQDDVFGPEHQMTKAKLSPGHGYSMSTTHLSTIAPKGLEQWAVSNEKPKKNTRNIEIVPVLN